MKLNHISHVNTVPHLPPPASPPLRPRVLLGRLPHHSLRSSNSPNALLYSDIAKYTFLLPSAMQYTFYLCGVKNASSI